MIAKGLRVCSPVADDHGSTHTASSLAEQQQSLHYPPRGHDNELRIYHIKMGGGGSEKFLFIFEGLSA